MISDNIAAALNKQLALEAYASYYYLAMSSWCDREGLDGAAAFMRQQSDEEREHMMRLFDYISEVDAHAIVPTVQQPPSRYSDIRDVMQKVYEHEQKVTEAIHDVLEQAIKENDYQTQNFLQWYVAEQREEEAQMRSILDRIKLIGEGPQSLYYIDKELSKFYKASRAEEAAEVE